MELREETEITYRVILVKAWELRIRHIVLDVGETVAQVSREEEVKEWRESEE